MNLQNFYIEKEPAPSTDWKVYGDIEDDNGNVLGTFGPDGTSVNVWWVMQDEQFKALDSITTVEDPTLGPVRMQNVLYRMSQTPGEIKWTGRKIGQDTHQVLADTLNLSEEKISQLEKLGIIKLGGN